MSGFPLVVNAGRYHGRAGRKTLDQNSNEDLQGGRSDARPTRCAGHELHPLLAHHDGG